MKILRRLHSSLRNQGLGGTIFKLRAAVVDRLFDWKFGIETCSWAELDSLTVASGRKEGASPYQPTHVLPLRLVFKEIQSLLPPESVLLDIGSGKGRILFVAAEFGFRGARGVEFAHELCEIARRNAVSFKKKSKSRTEFKITEADAARYPIAPEENVFVLYNPFDGGILSAVLDNISASIQQTPRKVLIVYYNPRWKHVIENRQDFTLLREFDFGGKFSLYANRSK